MATVDELTKRMVHLLNMDSARRLAATFLAHATVRFVPSVDVVALEHLLARAWEISRVQWPTVELPAELFVKHLAERLPEASPTSPIEPLLSELSLADLYLACACLQGMEGALEVFERNYLAKLPGVLRRDKLSDSMLEDICQLTRIKLLVPTPEGRPKIAEYKGRGSLQGWVRVVAMRIGSKLLSAQMPAPDENSDSPPEEPDPGGNPEDVAIQDELRRAMREAFSTLPAEDRRLLRLYYVDALSTYELAELLGVSQPTISRRLKGIRETLYKETQRPQQKRLGPSPRDKDFYELSASPESQFDVIIRQLLMEEDALPRPPEQG